MNLSIKKRGNKLTNHIDNDLWPRWSTKVILLYLLTLVLTGLEDMDEPLQLVGGISGVHH